MTLRQDKQAALESMSPLGAQLISSYTQEQMQAVIGGGGGPHEHPISEVTGLEAALDAKSDTHTHPYAADDHDHDATYAPLVHSHDYAEALHGHLIADTAGLQTALDGKAASGHNHAGVYEPANANLQAHVAAAHAPADAQKNADITKAEIEAKLTGEISSHSHAGGPGGEAFPVGSIFIAVVATNPGTLLGYGTWAAFAAGRVLVGLDAGQTEFDTVRETGGAKTHTLQTTEIPAHTHVITSQTATTGSATSYEHGTLDTSSAEAEATEVTGSTGGGGAHNNLQPYIVCYFWERVS